MLAVLLIGAVGLFTLFWWVASWVAIPAGVFAAWPLVALALAVQFLPVLPAIMHQLHHRLSLCSNGELLATPTGEWLKLRLRALGLRDVAVFFKMSDNAFDPKANAILLRDAVAAERTARSRTIAAHELGHALLYNNRPRLARLLWWCREWHERLYYAGLSLLIGGVAIAVPGLPAIASGLLAAGALATLGVLIDEAAASLAASRVLELDREIPAATRHDAATSLALAFFSYAIQLVVMVLPLVFPPQLGPGVIEPAGALAGWWGVIAEVGALIAIAASLLSLVAIAVGNQWWITGVALAAWTSGPAMAFAVAGQPEVLAHPWVIALAVAASWRLMTVPVFAALGVGLGRITRWLQPPMPWSPKGKGIREYVARAEQRGESSPFRSGWLERVSHLKLALPFLPIALAYGGFF